MATTQQPTRGRGRPRAEVKHKPCAFTYTVNAAILADLERVGVTPDKAKRLARQAANTALFNILSQQKNASL